MRPSILSGSESSISSMAVVVWEKGNAWMGAPPRKTVSCPLVILLRSSADEGGPLTRVMGE
eukprot:15745939-Heterocapsa_arctica.AAC.1